MTLTLPLPSRKLSPNARLHWRAKAKLTRLHRHRAKLAVLAVLGGYRPPFVGYSLAFFWPDRRRRDDDNAEASTKAYRDGIADALGVDDSILPRVAVSTFATDPGAPRLVITLHP